MEFRFLAKCKKDFVGHSGLKFDKNAAYNAELGKGVIVVHIPNALGKKVCWFFFLKKDKPPYFYDYFDQNDELDVWITLSE